MNKKMLVRSLGVAVLLASAACANPAGPTNDDSNGSSGAGTTVSGQMLALTIDGTAFQPTAVVVTNAPANGPVPELLQIIATAPASGSSPSQSVSIMVPGRVGSYDVRGTSNTLVRLERGVFGSEQWWEASGPLGTGTIEITSRTANGAEGRVSATMVASGTGAGATSRICAGTFSVRF